MTKSLFLKLLLLLLLPDSLSAQINYEKNQGSLKAMEFLNSLEDAQKKKAVFPFDEMNRYDWHYVPAVMLARTGICVKDMSDSQKQALYSLIQAFLSEEGYTRTKSIMNFEYLLKEMDPNNLNRIPENYYVAVYGSPGTDIAWGWKFSGHHLALNFTVVDDKLAFAPFFFGVYPAEVKDGPKQGTRLIKDEEYLGFELVNSLSKEQKQKAVFHLKAFTDIVTTNSQLVGPMKPVGIEVLDLTLKQKSVLNKLIVSYLLSMPADIAKTRMERITKEDMNLVRFGWAGGTEPGIPHYYRVQGNTFLIEFDNTQNNANHIHSVWRDFNGDYGRDLLNEHYHDSHHQNSFVLK
jgi:hypothetical protein